MKRSLAVLTLVLGAVLMHAVEPARAIEPDEMLADPALEARARTIYKELRCVVCQNQSIDDSQADIAHDMRRMVRERLVAGDSNQQIVDAMVARYGEYVLLRPPFQANTLALWIGPPLMAAVVAALVLLFLRAYQRQRGGAGRPEPLTPNERARLDALVEELAAEAPAATRRSQLRAELEQPFVESAESDDGSGDPTR